MTFRHSTDISMFFACAAWTVALGLGTVQAQETEGPDRRAKTEPMVAAPVPDDTESDPAAETPVDLKRKPESRVIEEIIVTATKREASVREIAGSVTALTGQQLEDAGLQDIDDIVDAVPGVNLYSAGQASQEPARITIRGISAGSFQNDTVGVFIDETPFTDVFYALSTADANPFDMSSIEVLKGPVGTLFGGSALNGAIRFIPQKPVMGEWQTKVFSQYSTNAHSEDVGRIVGAAVNIPIGETLALRVVANDRNSEGTIDNLNQTYQGKDVDKVSQLSRRAALRWQPLERLDLSLMFIGQDTFAHDLGFADTCCGGGYERSALAQPAPSESSYQIWQMKGIWEFDWAELVLLASNSDKHFYGNSNLEHLAAGDPPSSAAGTLIKSDTLPRSQELRLVSAPGGRWDWLAGLYNYNISVASHFDIATSDDSGGAEVLPNSYIADVAENAVFGEVNWRFGSGFELTGGLRLYAISLTGEIVVEGAACFLADPTCPLTGLRGALELDNVERGISPKLGLKWEINDRLMSYASAARGFRFGGANAPAGYRADVPPTYGSDALYSYETGIRAQWFDDSLITDATVFVLDWADAQYATNTEDGTASFTDNVGEVKGNGLEGQIVWRPPLRGVSLALTGAYAKIETAKDYTAPSATGTGTTTPAGTPWPRAPKWQTVAALGWSGQFGERQISTALTHSYFGKAIQNFQFLAGGTTFGYSTYDFQVTVKRASVSWWPDLALNFNNLTNTQGLAFIGAQGAPTGSALRGYAVPRNISLRLSFDF